MGWSNQSFSNCQPSLGNRGSKHLHGLQNKWQMIQKWVHRHSEDSSFVRTPPPETHAGVVQQKTLTLSMSMKGRGEKKRCFSHRQRASRHCELFVNATFPRLSVRQQRAQGDDSFTGRREWDIQRAARKSRKSVLLSVGKTSVLLLVLKIYCNKWFYPNYQCEAEDPQG